jgi:hypothetical protein
MPEITAFGPVVRSTVIDREPPDWTLTGKWTHAPASKSPVRFTLRGPLPSSTVIRSRRPTSSQSTA